jgi:hypothetical protein
MRIAKFLAATAAISMAALPVAASAADANPAAKLSVASSKAVRAASTTSKSSKAVGAAVLIPVIIVGVTGILIATGAIGDDDDADSN